MRPLRCIFGSHDIERLPSPPGIMRGLAGPVRCRRCPYSRPGFRYPPMPTTPPVSTSAAIRHASHHEEGGNQVNHFEAFKQELKALCRKHRIQLSTSGYDALQAWDLCDGEEPIFASGFEDHTGLQATPRAFDCQEFHELCMDYRGAMTPSQANVAYEKLQAYCTANVAYARGGAA
jgi:hypothetical protein